MPEESIDDVRVFAFTYMGVNNMMDDGIFMNAKLSKSMKLNRQEMAQNGIDFNRKVYIHKV